jgi:hypothetical protein
MYDGIDSNDFFNKKNFLEKVEFSPIWKIIKKKYLQKKKKKKLKLKRFPSKSRILIIIFAKITSGKTIPSICPKSVTYEAMK